MLHFTAENPGLIIRGFLLSCSMRILLTSFMFISAVLMWAPVAGHDGAKIVEQFDQVADGCFVEAPAGELPVFTIHRNDLGYLPLFIELDSEFASVYPSGSAVAPLASSLLRDHAAWFG